MFGHVEADAAAESVECGPFVLPAGRRDGAHHELGDVIGGMRRDDFVDDSAGRPDIRRKALEAAIGKLGTRGEGLGHRAERQGRYIIGRELTDGGIPSSAAVVEAHTNMSRPAHPGLDVNAGFSETDLRAIQIHVSGVDEELADIWLLGWLVRGRWLLGDEARSHEEQRRREQYQTGYGAMRASGGLLRHLTSLHTWASDTGFQTPGFRQRMDNRVAFSGGLAAGTGTRQCEANIVLKMRS